MELLNYLVINNNFIILEQQCRDPHFNEMYFKLLNNKDITINIPEIKNIKRYSSTKFICECHWSTVDIELEDK
jgi:hypothetical protein